MTVSIITICYNSEKNIASAIESVLSQSYKQIEYIVVDGNSTDGTVDKIKEYEPLFNGRMKWISENDNGLYDALNKGLSMATGDIVGCLHSDDFFSSPDILSDIVETFQLHPFEAVCGDVHFVSHTNLKKVVRKCSSRIFKRSLMRFGLIPAHPTIYMKRSCYEQYGLYNISYKIGGDFELLLRYIFIHRIKIVYLPKCFVTMRTGGISTSGLSSHKTIMKEHLRAFKENEIYTNRFFLSLRYLYKLTELRGFF